MYEKTLEDLNLHFIRVKALESEFKVKTTKLNANQNAIQKCFSKADELEENSIEKK